MSIARSAILISVLSVSPWCITLVQRADAQVVAGDVFADGKDGAKVHVASGFVCPESIGLFQRDAVGESDPETHTDFCAYWALNGAYGTIRILPLTGDYDAKASLAREFAEQEQTGGKMIAESSVGMKPAAGPPFAVYTRSYETARLEDYHYRVLFSGAAVKTWAVESVIEFADPRDAALESDFLRAVYDDAASDLAGK